jgi:hypothetical protein
MINKIISGGQTGADQGGLIGAVMSGIETGGTAPHGWLTDDGPNKELLEGFGLIEGPIDFKKYPKRTRLNVKNSDGTLLIGDTESAGTRLTIEYCIELSKPYIINPTAAELKKWIDDRKIKTLNVAGNRERKNPGITQSTAKLITDLIKLG